MHFRVLFPSLYLAAHDLNGKEVVLTIRQLLVEELKTERGSEKKPVLYFEETKKKAINPASEKRLVVNKTNAVTIAGLYGNEVNDWTGKRITVYATTVSAFGKQTDAIRVKPVAPPPVSTETATATGTK